MPGLEDLYREIILDHYRAPRNRGELPAPPAVVAQGHNPLCGDEITVYLQLDGDVVGDVKVGGQGCSISQSSASMMIAGDQGPQRRRGARPRPAVQGDDVDRGRRSRTATATATASRSPSATSRRCRAWSSSRCASSAPRSPGTPCSTHSTVDDAEERARAGRAIRDLGHAFVGHHAAAELLDEVATTLDALTGATRRGSSHRDRATVRSSEEWKRGVSDAAGRLESYDDRPFSGRSSPWGVDLEVHRHGDEIEARCIAARGARGRTRTLARRHRRRTVRRRVRVRARCRRRAGVHRRADDPLRRTDAAAPADRLPRPAGRA